MRNNQPVTQQEYLLADDDFLISRTDAKGRITYASPAFVRASGFSLDELMGASHNIVRHPDMPPAAFANLWETIKKGQSWNGFVKNRRKNGDHYWVYANVTPIFDSGQLTGYTSVRVKPSREDVAKADTAYRDIIAGRGNHLTLHRGQLRKKGLLGFLSTLKPWSSLQGRLVLFTLLAVFFIALNAILGVYAIHTSAHVNSMYILLLATSIIGSLSLAGLGYLIIRRVKFPLQAVRDFTLQLAAGNLEAQLNEGRLIEVKQLTSSLSTLRKGLISIASDVRGDMELFLISAREIAQGNQDLASRTDEQAHSLQQTASSMEEITSTVEQNASNAKQASQLAGAATCSVQTNGKVMRDVVGKMNAITESAHKMREIINVIDAIAFQTNILALNASVEAARAGEQGKGFAVVATEVRNLASRSATAAQEIRHLIDNSSQQIEMGADLVRGAEMGIEDVIQAVTKVNDIIGEISVASSEQSSGITLVNQAVAQMDAVTQQNAILVQDAARIAKRLEDQVSEVERAIAVFRLERVARKQT